MPRDFKVHRLFSQLIQAIEKEEAKKKRRKEATSVCIGRFCRTSLLGEAAITKSNSALIFYSLYSRSRHIIYDGCYGTEQNIYREADTATHFPKRMHV